MPVQPHPATCPLFFSINLRIFLRTENRSSTYSTHLSVSIPSTNSAMSYPPRSTPLPEESYAIVGILKAPEDTSFDSYRNLHPRREVTAFWNDTIDPDAPIQRSLMIQGMKRFKDVQVDDYKSFFQTAGLSTACT
jgi:hypothetical protein